MHHTRFETLLTAFAASPSRRTAMHALGGLGLAIVLGNSEVEAKHKKHKKKHHRSSPPSPVSPPSPPPPPPPPPTCETVGCPYTQVCQAGVCVACAGRPCNRNEDCCTGLCGAPAVNVCQCRPGNQLCTSNAN